jgi:glycosyltransferase involved in cell wall biosynthesis
MPGGELTFNRATTVIVTWKKVSRRYELLSKALGVKLWFFADNAPYVRAFFNTLLKVASQKPRVLIVQLPQGPLLLEALFLKKIMGCKIVSDVHTGFLVTTDWKGLLLNAPFVRFLRNSDLIIMHNYFQLNLIPAELRNKTIVVFDPWYIAIDSKGNGEREQERYIVFPASFASDEPLEEVISSVNSFNINVKMYITGNWKRQPRLVKYASDRIVFTGYLPSGEFHTLLAKAAAVITGTKREYTSLMSGWEAVAYAKPLALTRTGTLKSMFQDYAVFYDWKNGKSIADAIKKILVSEPDIAAREKLKSQTVRSIKTFDERLKKLTAS